MPTFAPSRRQMLLAVVCALALVLVGGRLLERSPAPAAPAAARVPPEAQAEAPASPPPERRVILVDVEGAVRRPGLYRLPEGARVADAIARAGGLSRQADPASVNRAAPVSDGQQVLVPQRLAGAGTAPGTAGAAAAAGAPAGPISLSSATVEQLETLPGVGPVTAEKIVAYRQEHGAFRSVDELDAIPGIGPARVEQLRDLVVP